MATNDSLQNGSSSDSTSLSSRSLSASRLGKTLLEATQHVLRRRFRVLLLVRDAYNRMIANQSVLEAVWEDLRSTLRLLLAWVDRSYRQVSWPTLAILTAALIYLVTPLDVIPDALGALGFVDDVALIGTAVEMVRGELERFRRWEEASPKALSS